MLWLSAYELATWTTWILIQTTNIQVHRWEILLIFVSLCMTYLSGYHWDNHGYCLNSNIDYSLAV